ncbi:hypothetical protein CCR97_08050 [Rhodoplanes elegans]|uniref:Uncharacterized protein n=1 Tax=Rhodoplanes elegans TaxID=29408 RepID=A0A327KNI0_9BRAD|nr:hypothetical protein [Rhodoplanes elegans]MBK5958071.1 hypothetical protein [Rhodoplanes elegans]MBK5958163.1 hypothetical protein [Rhodoplanes elegans]RAI40450.1 hypothetical protein CH338_06300 [Rhodoplanes elegans]
MLDRIATPITHVPRRTRLTRVAAVATAQAKASGADALAAHEAGITAAFRAEFREPNNMKLAAERTIRLGPDNDQSRIWFGPVIDLLIRRQVADATQACEALRWHVIRERRIAEERRTPDSALFRAAREALLIARWMRRYRLDHWVPSVLAVMSEPRVGATVHVSAETARFVMTGR